MANTEIGAASALLQVSGLIGPESKRAGEWRDSNSRPSLYKTDRAGLWNCVTAVFLLVSAGISVAAGGRSFPLFSGVLWSGCGLRGVWSAGRTTREAPSWLITDTHPCASWRYRPGGADGIGYMVTS
jgi:hypothetical protein